MVVIDLKIFSEEGHTSASQQKEMADELWKMVKNGVCGKWGLENGVGVDFGKWGRSRFNDAFP